MGSAIGQTPAQLSAVRTLTAPREGAVRPRESAPETPDGVRAGFGANTVSPAAAALLTLDGNLERARDIVPTVEELRAQLRAARAEAAAVSRDAQSEARIAAVTAPPESLGGDEAAEETSATVQLISDRALETEGLPPPAPFRPAAGPQVRAFSETSQAVLPPPPPETPRFAAQDAPGNAAPPQARLNLFA